MTMFGTQSPPDDDPPLSARVWTSNRGSCWHKSRFCAGRKSYPVELRDAVDDGMDACPVCTGGLLRRYAESL